MANKTILILQGAGTMSLVAPEGAPPREAAALRQALEAHTKSRLPVSIFYGIGEIIDNRPLNEQNLTKITTRDRSSGRYHSRYIEVQENGDERTLVDERCQTDQSGNYDVLEAVPQSADRDTLCFYCFPPVDEVEREPTAGPI